MSIYGRYADSMVGGAMGSPGMEPSDPPVSAPRQEKPAKVTSDSAADARKDPGPQLTR